MAGYIDPERDQFDAFKALPRDQPVMMLNLLRFRERAAYPDGREATGAEAYAAYGRESAPVFRRVVAELNGHGPGAEGEPEERCGGIDQRNQRQHEDQEEAREVVGHFA